MNACGGGMNAAPLAAVVALPSGAAALPCFPAGLVLFGGSVFLSRAQMTNVIFLRANTAVPSLPSGCCFFYMQ